MNRVRFTVKIFLATAFIFVFAGMAQAQATRTWVSGVGDDVNPCSRTAPCKTFAGAISKTFINGEIDALDPGGFGTITITKSMTLDGGGTHASILASGTTGVSINIAAGNVNDPLRNVTLRNLSINGTGASGAVGTRTGINGINIHTSGANNVWIENTVVFNFSQNGLRQENTTSSTQIHIKNSVFRNNGLNGILASSNNAANLVRISAEGSHFTGNGANGINGGANSRITVNNCSLSGNTNAGALSRSLTAGINSVVTVANSLVANNGSRGLEAGGGGAAATSFIIIDGNNVSGNTTSAVLIGVNGEIDTYGNNHFFGNTNNSCAGCVAIVPANQ